MSLSTVCSCLDVLERVQYLFTLNGLLFLLLTVMLTLETETAALYLIYMAFKIKRFSQMTKCTVNVNRYI